MYKSVFVMKHHGCLLKILGQNDFFLTLLNLYITILRTCRLTFYLWQQWSLNSASRLENFYNFYNLQCISIYTTSTSHGTNSLTLLTKAFFELARSCNSTSTLHYSSWKYSSCYRILRLLLFKFLLYWKRFAV